MDDLSLLPISNGNHYPNLTHEIDNEIFDDDEIDENDQLFVNYQPEDEIEQQPVQNERGGRRKGIPRRLQLSPERIKAPTQRLLPLSLVKISSSVHHHDQPILTSDQEDEIEDIYHQTEIEQNYLQLDLVSKYFIEETEDILEIVDDVLADIVTIIVRDIKQQRRKGIVKTNGHSNHKQQTNGKHKANGLSQRNSTKSQSQQSIKLTDPSSLFNDLTKTMPSNSQQKLVKHKLSSFSSPPTIKRQKTSETSTPLSIQQQHQQLLWEMTQQLMMSTATNDADSLAAVNSSLLKQQLLGLTQPDAIPKQKSRPSKPQAQSPVTHSTTNIIPSSTAHTSPFERGNFAPRRRGRPPKYVTDRGLAGLSSLDLDPSSLTLPYDQLFAAMENGGMGANVSEASSAAAFQSALASMLGQQAALSIPSLPGVRNGVPASLVKNSAGQARHSLPANASKSSHGIGGGGGGLEMPLMATKKRGPGRPPKSQMSFDPHQILQATQRLNSPTHAGFPPTMVPSSPNSFNLNAAFVEMLQQQQQQQQQLQ